MSKNLIARIAVALVAIPSILWVCYQDNVLWVSGMVTVFALIAMGEFLWQESYRPKHILFWLSFLSMYIIYMYNNIFFNECFVLIFLVLGMVFAVGKESPEILFKKYTKLIFGIVYIGMLYPFVWKVYITPDNSNVVGGDWMLFLFMILWVGDSMALFVGKSIGKHKLSPSVSPNKTIEGFVGGLLGAIIVGVIMYFWKFNWLEWYEVLPLAIGCSIFGQLGDLVESMWKRSINIKDSSNLIPGHGGILDRFDSLLFAAPFMYYYKMFFLMS